MTSRGRPDDIARVLDLIAAPWALEIFYGLSVGQEPAQTVPPGTGPTVISAALERMTDLEAVTVTSTSEKIAYSLTPRGERLLNAFKQIEAAGDASRADLP